MKSRRTQKVKAPFSIFEYQDHPSDDLPNLKSSIYNHEKSDDDVLKEVIHLYETWGERARNHRERFLATIIVKAAVKSNRYLLVSNLLGFETKNQFRWGSDYITSLKLDRFSDTQLDIICKNDEIDVHIKAILLCFHFKEYYHSSVTQQEYAMCDDFDAEIDCWVNGKKHVQVYSILFPLFPMLTRNTCKVLVQDTLQLIRKDYLLALIESDLKYANGEFMHTIFQYTANDLPIINETMTAIKKGEIRWLYYGRAQRTLLLLHKIKLTISTFNNGNPITKLTDIHVQEFKSSLGQAALVCKAEERPVLQRLSEKIVEIESTPIPVASSVQLGKMFEASSVFIRGTLSIFTRPGATLILKQASEIISQLPLLQDYPCDKLNNPLNRIGNCTRTFHQLAEMEAEIGHHISNVYKR